MSAATRSSRSARRCSPPGSSRASGGASACRRSRSSWSRGSSSGPHTPGLPARRRPGRLRPARHPRPHLPPLLPGPRVLGRRADRRAAAGSLAAGTIYLGLNLGAGLGLRASRSGWGGREALVIAGSVGISSSAIVTKLLVELRRLGQPRDAADPRDRRRRGPVPRRLPGRPAAGARRVGQGRRRVLSFVARRSASSSSSRVDRALVVAALVGRAHRRRATTSCSPSASSGSRCSSPASPRSCTCPTPSARSWSGSCSPRRTVAPRGRAARAAPARHVRGPVLLHLRPHDRSGRRVRRRRRPGRRRGRAHRASCNFVAGDRRSPACSGLGRTAAANLGLTILARGEFSLILAALGAAAGLDDRIVPFVAGYVLVLALGAPSSPPSRPGSPAVSPAASSPTPADRARPRRAHAPSGVRRRAPTASR